MRFLLLLVSLLSLPGFAQKVVIIEIDGDRHGRLRDQIERAVKDGGGLEIIPLKTFKDAAARRKLRGAAAMTPVGVKRVARSLKLDAAVGGELSGSTYKVVIYDRKGEQLWTRELKAKKGVLSDDYATKLARAIVAAAEQGAAQQAPAEPEEEGDDGSQGVGLDLTQPEEPQGTGDGSGRQVISRNTEPVDPTDPNRDTDLDDPNRKAKEDQLYVPYFRVWVGGATTWRNQCLRPGVNSCADYDLLATKPAGAITFKTSVPYLGLSVNADINPLAGADSRWIQGLGVNVGVQYGQSQTRIVEQNSQGTGPETVVKSDDIGFFAQLFWRIPFRMGVNLSATQWKDGRMGERDHSQPVGFAGLRGGFISRSFLVDPNAGTALPSSQRTAPTGFGFPVIGVDASLPLFHFLRVDLAFSYFISPRPAPEQIIGYGNLNDKTGGVVSSGFGLEAGLSGDLWGPIGYTLKWRFQSYVDHFYGQGQKWTVCNEQQCGGVGEESFHTLIWGLTASF